MCRRWKIRRQLPGASKGLEHALQEASPDEVKMALQAGAVSDLLVFRKVNPGPLIWGTLIWNFSIPIKYNILGFVMAESASSRRLTKDLAPQERTKLSAAVAAPKPTESKSGSESQSCNVMKCRHTPFGL